MKASARLHQKLTTVQDLELQPKPYYAASPRVPINALNTNCYIMADSEDDAMCHEAFDAFEAQQWVSDRVHSHRSDLDI